MFAVQREQERSPCLPAVDEPVFGKSAQHLKHPTRRSASEPRDLAASHRSARSREHREHLAVERRTDGSVRATHIHMRLL